MFLGLEVQKTKAGIFCKPSNQHKYLKELVDLGGVGLMDKVDTPMEANLKARKNDELISNPTRYSKLVGGQMYLTIIHLDISYAMNLVSQFMTNRRHLHFAAVKKNSSIS